MSEPWQHGTWGPPRHSHLPRPAVQRMRAVWNALVRAALLAVVGVTWFARGVLLGDGYEHSGPQTDVVRAIVDGINAHDDAALRELECADSGSSVWLTVKTVGMVISARFVGPDRWEPFNTYTAVLDFIFVEADPHTVVIVESGGKWCWQDIFDGTDTSASSDPPTTTTSDPVLAARLAPEPGGQLVEALDLPEQQARLLSGMPPDCVTLLKTDWFARSVPVAHRRQPIPGVRMQSRPAFAHGAG